MDSAQLERLKFPIGNHTTVPSFDRLSVDAGIAILEEFPARLRAGLNGLSEAELDRRYRPGGWSIRQVAYHLADSHTHIYIRFKWSLTEETPLIKAYDEALWAELPDARGPVELAVQGVESIHGRLTALMRTMSDEDFRKSFRHPETGTTMTLFDRVACYAWHCDHHLAHIGLALKA